MCGKAVNGASQTDVEGARKRYEIVLHKHIEMILNTGKSDASAGRPQKTVKNPIDVSTLRELLILGFHLNMLLQFIKLAMR